MISIYAGEHPVEITTEKIEEIIAKIEALTKKIESQIAECETLPEETE